MLEELLLQNEVVSTREKNVNEVIITLKANTITQIILCLPVDSRILLESRRVPHQGLIYFGPSTGSTLDFFLSDKLNQACSRNVSFVSS